MSGQSTSIATSFQALDGESATGLADAPSMT